MQDRRSWQETVQLKDVNCIVIDSPCLIGEVLLVNAFFHSSAVLLMASHMGWDPVHAPRDR